MDNVVRIFDGTQRSSGMSYAYSRSAPPGRLRSMNFVLTTDANVATRRLQLAVADAAGNAQCVVGSAYGVTANTSVIVSVGQVSVDSASAIVGVSPLLLAIPMLEALIEPGGSITIAWANAQAGDRIAQTYIVIAPD